MLLLGIGCMVASVLLFSVFNATAKWLASDYSPFQIMFFRGLFGLLPVLLLVLHNGGGVRAVTSSRFELQVLRGFLALGTNILFIFAYQSMPLADAVAIGYASPIFVTLLSIALLSERVGVHRWSAILVGFIGVLLVAQPGVGLFDPAAFYALAGTVFYALMIIVTRKLGRIEKTLVSMAHSTVIFTLACSLTLPFVWHTPTLFDWLLFLVLGFVSGGGMFLFIQAYRYGEAALIAPFDYTAIVWALLLGFVIWGDLPNWLGMAGIVIIVASGLYIIHRDVMRHREPIEPAGSAR